MRRFLENKIAFAATFSLFAIAFAWNALQGTAAPAPTHLLLEPEAVTSAHGPSIPPDPWENGLVAHGPSIPPDPWENGLAA
jgi:hypothetical protein